MGKLYGLVVLLSVIFTVNSQYDPHFFSADEAILHLFQWPYSAVADECRNYLGTAGFGGVQVGPITEHVTFRDVDVDGKILNRPWWEFYQPVSYRINTLFGTEEEFENMVAVCNSFKVRVYVDVVMNHMSGNLSTESSGNCQFDYDTMSYPCEQYSEADFHPKITLDLNSDSKEDYYNHWLYDLADLDTSIQRVRNKFINFMNTLLDYGVAGFRIDSAQHISPDDLEEILTNVNDVNTTYFPEGGRPFYYLEVKENGPIPKKDYVDLGRVTEFNYSIALGKAFGKKDGRTLAQLSDFGFNLGKWGLVNSDEAIVFVDNHDAQKDQDTPGDGDILTFKDGEIYRMAVVFSLAWPYGAVRYLSSYNFTDVDQGPPMNTDYTQIIHPVVENTRCSDLGEEFGRNWICEHRYPAMTDLVVFRNYVAGSAMSHFWFNPNDEDQIAFTRGELHAGEIEPQPDTGKGFVVINNSEDWLNETLQTYMPEGRYCDVVGGVKINQICTSNRIITVDAQGFAEYNVNPDWTNSMQVIYGGSKLN